MRGAPLKKNGAGETGPVLLVRNRIVSVATPGWFGNRLEALAAADWCYDEMERRMRRVTAFLDERFWSLVTEADLN